MANVDEFLEALHTNEEIKAFMAEHAPEEGMSQEDALAALAKQFGFDVTADELVAAIAAKATAVQEARDAAEAAVVELSDEDLAGVSGGYSSWCKDTYDDADNCWSTDSCHNVVDCYGGIMR